MSHSFKTPSSSRIISKVRACKTPVTPVGAGNKSLTIPASPAMKKMGFGTGVTVYLFERFSPNRGKFGSPWAVKKINSKLRSNTMCVPTKDDACSPQVKRKQTIEEMCNSRLAGEAKLLCSFNHPNIIGFRDYTTAADGTKCLAMEAGERDLYSIIEDLVDAGQTDPLPVAALTQVCQDVSSALRYLHEEHRLVHGDLKSANLLVKGDFKQVKLCDFGVSLKLDQKMVALPGQCYIGTECWSPPEAVLGAAPITDRADIFAFGLTVWECLTLDAPHVHVLNSEEDEEFLSEQEREIKSEDREALFQELIGKRPSLPASAASLGAAYIPFIESFYHCTNSEPSERPSASQLVQVFALLRLPQGNFVTDLAKVNHQKELTDTDDLLSGCSDIDTSIDSQNDSLNSSYFTNETIAIESKSLNQSEQGSNFGDDEKSFESSVDTSLDLPKPNLSLSSGPCKNTDLFAQENKIKVNQIHAEESHDVHAPLQENKASGKMIAEDAQSNRVTKRPLEEKNELQSSKKISLSSP